MQNSSHSDQLFDSTATLDEIKHERNKWILAGIPFAPALFIFLIVQFLVYVDPAIYIPYLLVTAMMTFGGLYLVQRGVAWRTYYTYAHALQKYFPPPVTITKKYGVTKRGNTYVFALRGSRYPLYFAALKQSSIATSEKIRVPGTIRNLNAAHHFEGGEALAVAEGTFSIPTPEGNIISGEGLVLCLENTLYTKSQLTEETLHKTAEYADKYVSGKPNQSEKTDDSKKPAEGLNSPDF